jgi:hypothetical protein
LKPATLPVGYKKNSFHTAETKPRITQENFWLQMSMQLETPNSLEHVHKCFSSNLFAFSEVPSGGSDRDDGVASPSVAENPIGDNSGRQMNFDPTKRSQCQVIIFL